MGPPQAGVLVIGESLVDIVTTADGQTSEHVGGSPANVALTLARLGTDAHLLTTTGNDERGRRIRDHLTGNGVRLIPGGPTETPTSTAAATLASGGHASYEFDLAWRVPDAVLGAVMGRLADFSCVHTGSVATVLKPGAGQVTQALSAAREHATVSYDPNIRPAIMDDAQTVRPQVEHIITMSDVVKCSDEDAQWLYPRLDLDELAGRWLGLGASIVVVTRGPRGATAWSGPDRLDVPGKTLQVADTIGAGDSFSGGIIDALRAIGSLGAENRDKLRNLGRAGLEPILHQAISVSAITVSRPGADPPHRRELPEEHRLHGR